MKYSIKFALMALASPLAIDAGLSGFIPESYAVFASEKEAHTDEDDKENGDEHGETEAIRMSKAEQKAAGIVTSRVKLQALIESIFAPGEVTINQYATTQITPRIAAQVVARHVRMGDTVKKGQSLVTLSSVEMAEAQGKLILAEKEWLRTQKLGRDVVSEQRYIEAEVGAQQARAKVLAYGMTEAQLQKVLAKESAAAATGEFDLITSQAGTVISDDFIVGQFIEPGNLLFAVSDEDQIWVEAKLPPDIAAKITRGAQAWVIEDGNRLVATVVQVHHTVDEKTRTLAVRLQLDNTADIMHAGEFVDVAIQTGASAPVIAVPDKAIVLLEGKQVVFKREGGELHPTSLETGISRGGWTEVRTGLLGGDEIVIENAFLIKSLILKSKMGEGHGH